MRKHRKRWLLVFNCQVMGLANCLNLLCDEIDVEHYTPATYRKEAPALLDRWDEYERILVAPQLEHLLPAHAEDARITCVPTFAFNAYHPDICYLECAGGAPVKGPMGDYHSIIAFAAYRRGASVAQTVALFGDRSYRALGYYDLWDSAKEALLARFRNAGLPLDRYFAGWSRDEAFMYSTNHVRIHCLRDLARTILESAGKVVSTRHLLPHDNLAVGPVFPIYPEIGARLGVVGSYDFKPGAQYRFISLDTFVEESFEVYRNTPHIRPRAEAATLLERAAAFLGSDE